MPKRLLIITIVLLILVGGFFAFNSCIYNQKQADPNTTIDRYRGTLTGESVCLPHKNTDGPQTLECAYGIRTDSGEYYAVDWGMMSQENPEFGIGKRFSGEGLITPIEMLSTDRWQKYDIEGIFSITESLVWE